MVHSGSGKILRMEPRSLLRIGGIGIKRGLRAAVRFGSEIVLAMLAVLACFAIFLFGLKQIFPAGDPTQFWFQAAREVSPVVLQKGREIRMNLPTPLPEEAEEGVLAARLTFVQNEVKNKKADGIVWTRAGEGLGLFDRDAIQTLSHARAVVTFDPQNYLDMDENSLVIIKKLERNRILKEKRSFMVMIEGSLRGKIDGSGPDNVKLEVATPTAVAQVSARDSQDRKADFQVHVNPDQTSTVTVYKGVAKVTAQGVTVEVKDNQTTRIGLTAPPEAPRAILEPVTLISPSGGEVYFYRDFPPEISFSWSAVEGAGQYHLQIAKEGTFRERVLDEVVSKTTFVYGDLRRGAYLWRVAALDAKRVEGAWSGARELEGRQSRTPPSLKILSPKSDQVINREKIWITGASDPRAKVYINGKKVVSDGDGRFKQEVPLKKGINLILVESVDSAGNASFQRRVISRKF